MLCAIKLIVRCLTIAFALLLAACSMPQREANPLVGAARGGDTRQIRALIAAGADPNALDAGGNEWTPLIHAVHKHQLASAEALIAAGADPNRSTPSGMTPLEMAAGYGHADMVALLLRHGARATSDALDAALSGANDIDDFTIFRCQDAAAAELLRSDPNLCASGAAHGWAKVKRCAVLDHTSRL